MRSTFDSPDASSPAGVIAARKADHLRIAASGDALHARGTGLEALRLRHLALPGRDLAEVRLDTELLGHRLRAPVIVSAMTGGTPEAALINARLTRAAAAHGIGMVLGSGRPLLADPALRDTYLGTDRPPLLIANLGASQLLEHDGIDQARRLIDLLEADALSIHLNPLQEAVQPEGEPRFAGLVERIAELAAQLHPLPVVVKEVGFGLHATDVGALCAAGVAAVDVAGAGGTNWALVEGARDPLAREVAQAFARWGTPTAQAVRAAAEAAREGVAVIASGGIRDGVEAAAAIALGARVAGFARHLLIAAQHDRADDATAVLIRQLRIAVWLTGADSAEALGPVHLEATP